MMLLPRLTNWGTPNGVTRPLVRSRLSLSRTGRNECRRLLRRAVAVLTRNLDRGPPIAIQLARSVHVLDEVAVDAVHPFLEVDVLQVHRLLPQVRIVERNDIAVGVEEVPLAIALVDLGEHPAVTVVVGPLRLLQRRVLLAERSRGTRDRSTGPRDAASSGLNRPSRSIPLRVGFRCTFGYIDSPSVSSSHHM